ncbi:glycoside hydrolase family 36 protein [Anaerocolumna sp. MB42-C2]|uniref:glycoside hydrolase family 36 protein n=1 Tax=Anaerocolumna sp. MB42-C2 TaxID=3070997 RepID=UPI0027DFD4AC|nr:glycoside hydrolase family 36 protein [Anaerocolumna sp. MB42-C2]WMJ86585.1 alpha-galactosidase [Anaerocolumna sp. MB42-C2]
MDYYVELKLRKDAHNGGFSNGLTLCGSESTKGLERILKKDDKIVYKNNTNHYVTMNMVHNSDTIEVSTLFENKGTESTTLEMLSSFAIKGIKADKIHRLQSFWSAEGKLRTETTMELHLEPSWNQCGMRVEKFGNLGSMPVRKYFPFIALENSETQEFTAVQLYSPYSWQIEILCKEDETLSLVGGIADRDFGHWFKNLSPGETFTTPKAVIARGNSLYEVCDKLVKAQKPEISQVDLDMGIMFNEYCTTWGNPTLENIKKICNKLKNKAVKYLVIDSGWYGKNEGWWASIGDWDVNYEKFPGGLKKAADYIRENGMIPGLWFEMESVGRLSKHWNNIEHLLKKDGVVLTVGDKRFWDMSDPWVIKNLHKMVIETLKECGFGYIKIDYNDTIGIGCDGAESLGEGLRQRILATQDFFRKIKEEIPDIVIENCSSGGHRLEPSMMELVSQASFSDAHETTAIPIIAANMHRVIKPSQSQIWAVMRGNDSDSRIYYSIISTFFGRMCLSGDIYDLTDKQWSLIEEGMDFYREAADIIKSGTTIKIENRVISYNKPEGEQIVIRKYENKFLVIAHRFENSKETSTDYLKHYKTVREYGAIDCDFSAKAWLLIEE